MAVKINAVIFDQDGLMFDTERLALEGWEKAAHRYGICLDKEFLRDLRGCKPDKVKEAFLKKFGGGLDYDAIFEEKRQYSYQWIRENGVPVKPGLKELLIYLKERGVKTAVATASSEGWTQGNVKSTGLDGYFDEYIYGDMVKEAKPNPAIFLMAAKVLGEEPGRCIILEDSFNGIKAAHAGGFLPIMVPDQDEPDEGLSKLLTARCSSLADVIGLFEDGTFEPAGTGTVRTI
ncbi:HAD family phosphatase [Enterocloster sp. OA13]|uniref:HAD family hydrolase n=1 Tax=Enterocloster sp. OA13 TaxID=2914161 RepID=UPI00046E823C|nr:HAD family phosphatase [Enterocloster sp. OA13]